MQVDTRERGFSYAYDAPLDMRMDPAQELTAAEIVNTWEQRRIAPPAARLRRGALRRPHRARDRPPPRPARTTFELVDAITAAIPAPARFAGGHPAKRTFQAIRIAVNDELGQIDLALPRAWDLLRVGGTPRRDLLPLARGPARQALPRRPHPRLHLPARPARLRLRPDAAGRAGVPALGRADAGRGRRQPALEVRPPAGRAQAHRRGGARMSATVRHARPPRAPSTGRSRPAPRGASPGPVVRRPVAVPGGAATRRAPDRVRARPRAARQPLARPRAARPPVDLAARRRAARRGRACRSRCSS